MQGRSTYDGHFEHSTCGWGKTTRTMVTWRQRFRHPTRNECMGGFAQILHMPYLIWKMDREFYFEIATTILFAREIYDCSLLSLTSSKSGWCETTYTLVPCWTGCSHPTRNQWMGWFPLPLQIPRPRQNIA